MVPQSLTRCKSKRFKLTKGTVKTTSFHSVDVFQAANRKALREPLDIDAHTHARACARTCPNAHTGLQPPTGTKARRYVGTRTNTCFVCVCGFAYQNYALLQLFGFLEVPDFIFALQ